MLRLFQEFARLRLSAICKDLSQKRKIFHFLFFNIIERLTGCVMMISVSNSGFNNVTPSISNGVNFQSDSVREATSDIQTDVVEVSKPQEKKSAWQKFKHGFTSVEKFFITAGEYIKGTAKGLFYGAATALCVVGADAVRGIFKGAPNALSTKGKILAGVAGSAVLGGHLFNANLNANQKKAEVDHRWGVGHNED